MASLIRSYRDNECSDYAFGKHYAFVFGSIADFENGLYRAILYIHDYTDNARTVLTNEYIDASYDDIVSPLSVGQRYRICARINERKASNIYLSSYRGSSCVRVIATDANKNDISIYFFPEDLWMRLDQGNEYIFYVRSIEDYYNTIILLCDNAINPPALTHGREHTGLATPLANHAFSLYHTFSAKGAYVATI